MHQTQDSTVVPLFLIVTINSHNVFEATRNEATFKI